MDKEKAKAEFRIMVDEAIIEAEKAMIKFPQPNYVTLKIAEEAGEVVRAVIHGVEGRSEMYEVHLEMRQLIAMLYRLWEEGDETIDCPPIVENLMPF